MVLVNNYPFPHKIVFLEIKILLSTPAKALPEYSKYRNPDAEAIVDLALYNYIEVGV